MNTLSNTFKKKTGEKITESIWGGVIDKINETVTAINEIPTNNTASFPNLYINDKGNLNIETSAEIGNTSKGKINIEAMNDIQLKPGDDIILYSHHRPVDKQDEVAVKVTDGDDIPVKLQLNTSEMLLTTKDKPGNNSDVLDVAINADTNVRGYLKVRAQAIDLRCEKHGGIALQPKGYDGDGNMNKIKFEHGGGDGLEFGTFNAEKTSIYTDEYRFKKDGVIKLATRDTEPSGKTIRDENTPTGKTDTGALKYVKLADDFYDKISVEDPTCTWEDIIKTTNNSNGLVIKKGSDYVINKSATIKFYNENNAPLDGSGNIDLGRIDITSNDTESVISDIISKVHNLHDLINVENLTNVNGATAVFIAYDQSGNRIQSDAAAISQLDEWVIAQLESVDDETGEILPIDFIISVYDGTTEDRYIDGDIKVVEVPVATIVGRISVITVSDVVKLINYMKTNNQGPWL